MRPNRQPLVAAALRRVSPAFYAAFALATRRSQMHNKRAYSGILSSTQAVLRTAFFVGFR